MLQIRYPARHGCFYFVPSNALHASKILDITFIFLVDEWSPCANAGAQKI